MLTILRSLIIVLVLAVWITPAQACLGPPLEHTIFFDKVPPDFYPGSDFRADVVANVVLEDVRDDGAHGIVTARVTKAISGDVKVSDHIQLRYNVTSCGPYHKKGEGGMIAAQYGDAGSGQKILVALTRPQGGCPDRSKMLDLRAAPDYGQAPLSVRFSAPAASEEGIYRIDFGDGQKSDLLKQCKEKVCTVDAEHAYLLRGTYAGILTLMPSCAPGKGCTPIRTGSAGLTVRGGEEPWASLSAEPISGKEPPLSVTFTIKGFGGPFTLAYGDGFFGPDFGYILNGRTVTDTHVYQNPGTFKAKLVSLGREYDAAMIAVAKRELSAACRDAIQKFRDGKLAPSALKPVCGESPIPLFEP
jgi:hypothetical protein